MRRNAAYVFGFALVLASVACSGSGLGPEPSATYTPEEQQVADAVQGWLRRLRPEAGELLKQQIWFADGRTEPRYLELVSATATYFWSADAEEVGDLWSKYPQGMEPGTVERLRVLAAIVPVRQLLQREWLRDGLDGYENAVLSSAKPTTTSRIWLLALDNPAFRALYEADPHDFDDSVLVPLSRLTRGVLDYVAGQEWFHDGLDVGEASVLVSLWAAGAEKEQIQLLTSRSYVFARTLSTTTSVLVVGPEAPAVLPRAGQVADVIKDVEAVWGPWPFRGAVLETKALDANCHGGSVQSSGIHLARLWLTTTASAAGNACFRAGVIAHELSHGYFGTGYPVWFMEGVAELGAVYVSGARSGYQSPRSITTRIERENVRIQSSDIRYFDQASAGADFLVRVGRILGRERMIEALRPLQKANLTSNEILEALQRDAAPAARADLQALIGWFFDGIGRQPAPLR